MAYPIIEHPVINDIEVLIGGTVVHDWVTNITGRIGSVPDSYFCSLEPGSCSIELYDINSTIDALLVPGANVKIRTIPYPGPFDYTNIYMGKIRDVSTTYEYDELSNRLVPRTSIETSDLVAQLANKEIAKNTFANTVNTEKISVAAFGSLFTTATGQTIAGASDLTTTYINQFTQQIDAVDAMNMVARSVNKFAYQKMDAALSSGNFGYASIPTSALPDAIITDGTHTGSPLYVFKMTDVDYGYDSSTALSELNITNIGLNRAPKVADDAGVEEIEVTYQATQSIGFDSKYDMQTVVATDNLGWNFIENTGSGDVNPTGVWPDNANMNFGVSPTMTDGAGGNRVAVMTCKTAFSSLAVPLMRTDSQNTFVSNPPGGATGSWEFAFRARAVTTSMVMNARIQWFNSAGTLLRTDTSGNFTVTNSAFVTVGFTVATPPTGAVTAVPVIVFNGAAAVGYQMYITKAYFFRQSTSGLFFDGDTLDNSSFLHTWTGERGKSPSQKNTNSLVSLGASVLARNTIQKKVKTVTLNAYQNSSAIAWIPVMMQIPTYGISICVNGVTATYAVLGYSFDISPESFMYTINVAKI